jgi:hypothetical protein
MITSKTMTTLNTILVLFSLIILIGCSKSNKEEAIEVISFDPMTNFEAKNGIVELQADLTNAVINGVSYPSKKQATEGKFKINFKIKNKTNSNKEFYYKVYYQNESYKYPDDSDKSIFNFYGSWQDTEIGFKKLPKVNSNSTSELIEDEIQIVGNPRNEKRYFGRKEITDSLLNKVINRIKGSEKWYNSIKEKSVKRKLSVEKVLRQDAIYILKHDKVDNVRTKRNPRVGKYSFILVVVDEETLDMLPDYIKHIDQTNDEGLFVNPYNFFFHKENEGNICISKSQKELKTYAIFDPKHGIYANKYKPIQDDCNCGTSNKYRHHAHFTEFYNHIFWGKKHNNIPLIDDVDDTYTQETFDQNAAKYPRNKIVKTYKPGQRYRIEDMSYASDSTCSSIRYDSTTNSIIVINKGNNGIDYPKKVSAGVKTRVGFTYGKFVGKIKFPELINRHNVWNGVTNAFWLLYQAGSGDWNNRGECTERGYGKKKNDTVVFSPYSSYSEIDIEITKAGKYINKYDKQDNNDKEYDPRKNDNVIVACTNHDLACKDVEDFEKQDYEYNGQKFRAHRWFDTYLAKFLKTPAKNDELFGGDYYLFEIGWYPDSIVWKIGPDRENMRTVGYMDHTFTKIPDNQMIAIMSQEFHHGDWWPTTPWHQDDIPYPKSPIIGRMFEVRVE